MSSRPPAADRRNNFGLIRLTLAVLVLYSHSYPLAQDGTNDGEPLFAATGVLTLGWVGVSGFFVVSGYLITLSWFRCESAAEFVRKRLLRIYPGYLVALGFSLAVGAATSPSPLGYLKGAYNQNDSVLRASLFIDASIVGTLGAFPNNPVPGNSNGSLWTLQPELRCYACVIAAGAFGVLGRLRPTLLALAAAYALYAVNAVHLHDVGNKFGLLAVNFLLGSFAAALWPDRPPRIAMWHVLAAIVVLALALATRRPSAVQLSAPLVLAAVVFGGAYAPLKPFFDRINKTDLSYGIYLYAFPVQQSWVHFAAVRDPLTLFAVSLPVTTGLAYLSWVYVEWPATVIAHRGSQRPVAPARPPASSHAAVSQ